MVALAASAHELESWDDDSDLDFSSGPLLNPSHLDPALTLQPPSDSEPASPAVDNDFDDVEGFFERVAGDWDDAPRTREEENESSVDSSRTNTTTGTLKGLMEGLSLDQEADTTLSLGAVVPSSSPPRAPTELDATPRTSKTTTLRGSSPLSVLLASSRSPSARHKVHHLGSTPFGQAQAVDDWDQDLEGLDSLQLGSGASDAGLRSVVKKGSFASHISLVDDEDDMSAFDEPQQEQVARKRISIASFTDAEDNGDGEDDFELPSTLSHVSLAPTLVNRPSNVSLNSVADSPVTVPPHTPTTPGLAVPAPQNPAYTTASSAPSSPGPLTPSRSSDDEGPSSSALDDDDDADFFEDLVLPSYFLAGAVDDAERKRAATPPTSEGEPDSDAPGAAKVDLQSILRAKLEARGGRGLLFHAPAGGASAGVSPVSPQEQERLARHREHDEDGDGADLARELRRSSLSALSPTDVGAAAEAKDEEWSAHEMRERMRAISGARAKEAQQAREAREAGRATSRIGVLRRTASDGKVPPAPGRRTVQPLPTRASTGAPPATRSSLPHAPSANVKSGIPQPVRPASAHGSERPPSVASSHSTEGGTTRRRGPPPAPSAASRGRARLRTTSLRNAPSQPDLRSTSKGRPHKLDPPAAASASSNRSLSPVPMTPSTPSSASRPSLRPKRSQQHLSAAAAASATSGRTLERKRSLQSMSALASPTPGSVPPRATSAVPTRSRQNSLRSPSPVGPRPSFAAPTAASSSRVRERVHSSPAPLVSASPASSYGASFAAATTTSSRPHPTPSGSSSVSERLLRPTMASASKARTPTRPNSPTKPSLSPSPRMPSTPHSGFMSGLRLPSAAVTLSQPLSSLRSASKASYGDGTELDAFDDLPVSKERERERVVPPSSSRKSSGASTATLRSGGGSWGRKEGTRLAQRTSTLAPEKKPGGLHGRKEGASAAREKEKGKGTEREKDKKVGDPEKKKVKRRREPHLIRHLGPASAIKVQGEMTYNPVLQRWEGNEAVLREFDKALTTSTRPALISPFSSTIGAPHRGSFAPARAVAQPVAPPAAAAAAVLPPGATTSASRGTAKVVGDMVFDPATCSWHAVNGPDAEDELELDWGGGTSGGEAADDEDASASGLGASSDVDGWELGERERMLKNRASFVLEEGSDEDAVGNAAADLSEGDGTRRRGHTTKRQMWRESQAAAGRSLAELGPWRTHDRPEDDGRRWLWELRALVLDIH
ncbi:hypothetical protein DMC30DRAFT_405724 [Rhodotorula diobovata]|uniref:Uncharacterized protein n=1 Tax=Rhodotorula diobovata TaxID=5288 RepID=A0A5C5FNF0_9BASI|nr:hypothetical protein DMC30DRAFT_405724 [Rhodotorula diobovata]